MSTRSILLVDNNTHQAQRITAALDAMAIPRPVHVRTGQEAIAHVAANECALCLLNYRLPDGDGLHALVELRRHRPDLPVIMLSDAGHEQVAIAAFHGGVVDYVPVTRGCEPHVAALVARHVRSPLAPQIMVPHWIKDNLPGGLFAPTYQNRLRSIGHHLDRYGYRYATIAEVDDAFVVRTAGPDLRRPQGLTFADRDLAHVISHAAATRGRKADGRTTRPLLPTGYEDFLRALGRDLDLQAAEAITVSEGDSIILVSGLRVNQSTHGATVVSFQAILEAAEVEHLLNLAFEQRRKKRAVALF